jgi:hypothetical protein
LLKRQSDAVRGLLQRMLPCLLLWLLLLRMDHLLLLLKQRGSRVCLLHLERHLLLLLLLDMLLNSLWFVWLLQLPACLSLLLQCCGKPRLLLLLLLLLRRDSPRPS